MNAKQGKSAVLRRLLAAPASVVGSEVGARAAPGSPALRRTRADRAAETDGDPSLSRSTSATMSSLVLEQIRRAILDGVLRPGERVKPGELAQRLDVSPTSVREALQRLEDEGLVQMTPYRGAIVAPVREVEVGAAFELIAVIEGLATRRAAERMTADVVRRLEAILARGRQAPDARASAQANRDFHDAIAALYDNPLADVVRRRLQHHILRALAIFGQSPERIAQADAEHAAILQALHKRNPELAERLAREHCENARADMISRMRLHMSNGHRSNPTPQPG